MEGSRTDTAISQVGQEQNDRDRTPLFLCHLLGAHYFRLAQQRLMGLHLISEGGDETRDAYSTTAAAATAAAEQVPIPSSSSDGDNGDGSSNSGNESGRNRNNGRMPDSAVRRRRSARSPAASTMKDVFRTIFKDVRSKFATSQKSSLPHGGAPTV